MSTQREITYSTGETSEHTGASQKQIRYWECWGYISEPLERNVCGDIAYLLTPRIIDPEYPAVV